MLLEVIFYLNVFNIKPHISALLPLVAVTPCISLRYIPIFLLKLLQLWLIVEWCLCRENVLAVLTYLAKG